MIQMASSVVDTVDATALAIAARRDCAAGGRCAARRRPLCQRSSGADHHRLRAIAAIPDRDRVKAFLAAQV